MNKNEFEIQEIRIGKSLLFYRIWENLDNINYTFVLEDTCINVTIVESEYQTKIGKVLRKCNFLRIVDKR